MNIAIRQVMLGSVDEHSIADDMVDLVVVCWLVGVKTMGRWGMAVNDFIRQYTLSRKEPVSVGRR